MGRFILTAIGSSLLAVIVMVLEATLGFFTRGTIEALPYVFAVTLVWFFVSIFLIVAGGFIWLWRQGK